MTLHTYTKKFVFTAIYPFCALNFDKTLNSLKFTWNSAQVNAYPIPQEPHSVHTLQSPFYYALSKLISRINENLIVYHKQDVKWLTIANELNQNEKHSSNAQKHKRCFILIALNMLHLDAGNPSAILFAKRG